MQRFSIRLLCLLAPLTLSVAAQAQTKLRGSVPAWANAKNFVAAANPSDDVGFRVYLSWNNPSAVEALAQAVSNPASSGYKAYLTPEQFRQQFAPSQAQVSAVQSWLRSQGFAVEYTPQNNHYVSAEGTVAQAAAAFATSFGMYSIQGLALRSPSSDVSIPNSLAGIVSGVVGLDDSAQLVHTNHTTGDAPPPPAFVSAQPCSDYWGGEASLRIHEPLRVRDTSLCALRLYPAANQGCLWPRLNWPGRQWPDSGYY